MSYWTDTVRRVVGSIRFISVADGADEYVSEVGRVRLYLQPDDRV